MRAAFGRLIRPLQRLGGRIAVSRFVALTIWRPGLFGTPTDRDANIYRIILPLFDLIAAGAGWRAIAYGVPGFSTVTGSDTFSIVWGAVMVTAGYSCLAGIVFPRLFYAELFGKIVLFAALCVYSATMLWLSLGANGENRSVLSSIANLALLVPAWRLGDIKTERRIRHNLRVRRA